LNPKLLNEHEEFTRFVHISNQVAVVYRGTKLELIIIAVDTL